MEWFGYIASVLIGFILGILGGGGSILAIPILVYIFHLNVVTASAYSLFIVGITSLVGAIPKYKDHLVDTRTGLLFGIPSIFSIFTTRKWIVPALPETVFEIGTVMVSKRIFLLGIFALLMILASLSMIRKKDSHIAAHFRYSSLFIVMEGVLIGFLTGLVGAGGGFLIIPALVFLTGLPFKTAVGTSLLIIAINSLAGFMGDVLNYPIDWTFLLIITGLAVLGMYTGHYTSGHFSHAKLRVAFGWFVLTIGALILTKEILLL